MDAHQSRRRSIITCPKCGHVEAKARICDIELRCRRCTYQFEAVIGPYSDRVCDGSETPADDSADANTSQARPPKPKTYNTPDKPPRAT